MNTPNKLTTLRIVLIPFFLAALLIDFPGHYFAALVIFAVASVTDWLDGYLARKYALVTNFGKFFDPLADKLLTLSAFICMVELDLIGAIPVFIILARELLITSLRTLAAGGGTVIAANWPGKVKTVLQMITICLFLFLSGVAHLSGTPVPIESSIPMLRIGAILAQISLWATVAVTLYSGGVYLWNYREFLRQ